MLLGGARQIRQPAVSSFFDELALSARRRSQIRRAQTLPVSTAGNGEVCPVLAEAAASSDQLLRDSRVRCPSSAAAATAD